MLLRTPAVLAAFLLSTPALADVPVFTADLGSSEAPEVEPDAFYAAKVAYAATINTRAIAENAVRYRPERLVVRLSAQGRTVTLSTSQFTPVHGFLIDESGAVVVDPDVPTDQISFDLFATGDMAELLLVVRDGKPFGRLVAENQLYVAENLQGQQIVRVIDRAMLAPDIEYHGRDGDSDKPTALPPVPKYIDHVRVLVVHTPDVTDAATIGGFDLNTRASAAVVQFNEALANSNVIQVQAIHVMPTGVASTEVPYGESPGIADPTHRFYAHRAWVRTSSVVAQLRNLHEADVVVLLVADLGRNGVAYLQKPGCQLDPFYGTDAGAPACSVGSGFAPFAFSVSNIEDAAMSMTVAHEIGHNFGMEHDPANVTPGTPSYAWSFGHYVSYQIEGTLDRGASTIMSAQEDCPHGCERMTQFSNPDIPFLAGAPSDASGTVTTDSNGFYRFNARTAALLAPHVAGFRGPQAAGRIFRHGFEELGDVEP